MKVAVVGHGQMGREVEAVLRERGHEPPSGPPRRRASPRAARSASTSRGADAVVAERRARALAAGARYVVGTTGWDAAEDEVRALVEEAGGGLVHAANFSVGVNLFYRIVRETAALLAQLPRLRPLRRSSATTARRRTRRPAPPRVLAGDRRGRRRQAPGSRTSSELEGALPDDALPRRRGARGRHRGRPHGRLRLRRRRDPAGAPRPLAPRLRPGRRPGRGVDRDPDGLPLVRRGARRPAARLIRAASFGRIPFPPLGR